jgi:hypothetical protein
MRRAAGAAAVGTACLLATSLAFATTTAYETLKVTVSPNKAGTKKKPANVTLNVVTTTVTPPGDERPTIKSAVLHFAKGAIFNGKKFPHCSQSTLNNRGKSACPAGSQVGTGKATAFASTIETSPKITAFNGPGSNKVELFLELENPVRIASAIEATITKTSGTYAYTLTVPIPQSLQVVAGIPVKLTYFQTKIAKRGYLQATSCPKSKKWPFDITVTTTGGDKLTANTTYPCK